MIHSNSEIGSGSPPHAAEVEPPAAVVHAGGSIDERSDVPTTAPTLKPCPFCGVEAAWIDDNGELDTPFGLVAEHSESCFLGPRMMADWSGIIRAWNQRAPATKDFASAALSRSGVTGLSLDSSTLCITLRFGTYEQASDYYVGAASAVENGSGVESVLGVTGNAVLLLGFISGLLGRDMPPAYELQQVNAKAGHLTVRRVGTANTYRISAVQLEGIE